MNDLKTAVLLIGFGGPTSMAEVRPFLQSVLEGVEIPQSRLDEVTRHYEIFQGASPYNEITKRQKESLEFWLKVRGASLPVYIGLRHALPSFQGVFEAMKHDGVQRVLGFVLSSFRCYASFEKYIKKLEEGRSAARAESIIVDYMENFYDQPLFLEAQISKIRSAVSDLSIENLTKTFFLFSAHSVPVPMSSESGYARQFEKASRQIVQDLKLAHWDIAYQSRSGNPRDPWLEPDVRGFIASLDPSRFRRVVLVPIGFLCDNVEVLYDLDIEAREAVEKKGLIYLRASTVTDHPKFIEMIGGQILQKIEYSAA